MTSALSEGLEAGSGRRLGQDLVANFLGFGAAVMMPLIFIPVYIHRLGMEGYGLIGIFTTLSGLVQVLDFGITTSINRELARSRGVSSQSQETTDLVLTLETICLGISVAIGVALTATSSYIARRWIQSEALDPRDASQAMFLIGLLVAVQWPAAFYQNAFMGLGRQMTFNVVRVTWAVLSYAGAAVIVSRVSASMQAFFEWQIAISVLHCLILHTMLWHAIGSAQRARVRFKLVRRLGRFAAGLSAITLTSLVMLHADRVILSRILTLKMFGCYMLAWSVARGLSVIIQPIFSVSFPRFTAALAQGGGPGLRELYRNISQLTSVLCFPVAALLAVFSWEILRVWSGTASTADAATPVLRLLVAGNALNGLLYLPWALELAAAWTLPTLIAGCAYALAVVPFTLFLTARFGPAGAASTWLAFNLVSLCVVAPLVHRRILGTLAASWFVDVAKIFAASTALVVACHALFPRARSLTELSLVVGMAMLVAGTAAAFAAPTVRLKALRFVRGHFFGHTG